MQVCVLYMQLGEIMVLVDRKQGKMNGVGRHEGGAAGVGAFGLSDGEQGRVAE